ncbi:hypothetical protein Ndes2526A_g08683 [Nannochloris sp. 'desiccata']
MKWSLSLLLVYFGFYLFIVFVSLSIACGLYYLAELIEEFTVTTKRILGYTCRAILVVHALLLIDRLPFHCLVLGFGAHISYIRLLKRFPYMQLSSPESLTAVAACLVSSAAWLYHWHKSYYTVEYILAFMLVTSWCVPFVFFLSMAGDQAVLPGAGGYPYSSPDRRDSGNGSSGGGTGKKQRRGLALRIFDVLRRKRDEVLPDVMAKFPASSGFMPKEKV